MDIDITECLQPENCNDPECQNVIVSRHEIPAATLDTMALYFSNPKPGPKSIPAADIAGAIADLDCSKWLVGMWGDAGNMDDNSDIVLTPQKRPYDPAQIDYSLALFRGIMRLHQPDSFHFYKARYASGKFTIVFEVLSGGAVVYCGNVNTDYP